MIGAKWYFYTSQMVGFIRNKMQSHSDNPLLSLCTLPLLLPHWLERIELQPCDWPNSCLILQCLELDVTCNTGY